MEEKMLEELEEEGAEVEDTIERLMGDQELYVEYLKKFPENQNICNLMDAIEKKDTDTAMKEVHTLKGVALNLGLLPLVDATMSMLLDFREGNPEEAMGQMDEVKEQFDLFKDIIEKYR